jgi:molecular chaperone GrpE
MAEKKDTDRTEILGGPELESPESSSNSPQAGGEEPVAADEQVEALEIALEKLAEAESKSAENLDGWQRALADFQNYKKRVERDRQIDQAEMKGDFIRKVLPVLDDLERALQNRPPGDAWSNGIELIRRKLLAILEAEGVRRIEAEGEAFDPRFHEAIAKEPVDGAESGTVIAVAQQGYTLGERVIRPAQVRVAA